MKIIEIEGIGPVYAEKLNNFGIFTVRELFLQGATSVGRKKLAGNTGIDESKILSWVNMADLLRIKGIGPQFAELLLATGVDTIKELRTRNAESLHAKLLEVHAERKRTGIVPSLSQVTLFINHAKELPPVVTH